MESGKSGKKRARNRWKRRKRRKRISMKEEIRAKSGKKRNTMMTGMFTKKEGKG